MENDFHIAPPVDEEDQEGAQRVLEEFTVLYRPTFLCLEHHLEHLMETIDPAYAHAYRPWHKALHDLVHGAYLMARRIPLPDTEAFIDAVRMFSFESAIQFLQDLCIICKIALQRDWEKTFREHIDALLFSLSILNRNQQQCRVLH